MTAKELIDMTVKELKKNGLIRDNKLNSFQRTERLLYALPNFRIAIASQFENIHITPQFVAMIDEMLKSLEGDPYYEIIPMKYFEHKTHEQIAEYFDVQPAAISKQRTRLINILRSGIFPDDYINELYNDNENV